MKIYQFTLTQPRSLRFIGGLVSVFAAISLGADAGNEKVNLPFAKSDFGHANEVSVSSGLKLINPSKLYSYKIEGSLKGKDGDMLTYFPKEIPFSRFTDVLVQGTPLALTGTVPNSSGTFGSTDITLVSKTYKSVKLAETKTHPAITLSLMFEAKISPKGVISLAITNVIAKANGKPIKGTLIFLAGSRLEVSTAPTVSFKAVGQPAFSEPLSPDPADDSFASVTVWRLGNLGKVATVDYATFDGNAIAGADYEATTGTLTFPKGEKELSIKVRLLRNDTKKSNSKFTILLSNPGPGVVFGKNTMNTVAIANVN